MPHIIIEHSASIQTDSETLRNIAFEACEQSGLFASKDIKTRVKSYDIFQIGKQIGKNNTQKSHFVHVTVKIMPGRTTEQQHELAQNILGKLTALNLSDCSHSVEIIELNATAYCKHIS